MENTDVKLKRKVQLRKKVDEPKQTTANHSPNIQQTKEKKSKTWIGILLAIIALGIIVFIFLSKPNKNPEEAYVIAKEKTVIEDKEIPVAKEVENIPTAETTEPISETANKENETEVIKTTTEENSVVDEPMKPANSSSTNTAPEVSDNIQAEAMKVIHGDYGVGKTRKEKLGERYQSIQNRVNELKREGVF